MVSANQLDLAKLGIEFILKISGLISAGKLESVVFQSPPKIIGMPGFAAKKLSMLEKKRRWLFAFGL